MVVAFPQEDAKVCQVSFRRNVPLLILQHASLDGGRMRLGERKTLDLRKAGSVCADSEKVSILSPGSAGGAPHLILELHMDDNAEIQTWAQALRTALETNAKAKPASPASASGECEALKAKSAKLQQRIASLETLSERRDKQMKRLLKRLDGAMQMLEALEDMCGQQRKVIQAQQQAIVALKEEGVDTETAPGPANPASPAGPSSPEREEEEEEEGEDGDVSEEKLMALLAQADQMERALKQMEALGITFWMTR
ncbi:unnamed protein product [Effrenium voratum]|uniref:PH domain-containing protein n=1 Tax=Effrenium voratum TaxID=2562239 RepID=A0AA36MNK9_9DINO|nr:unnamed protein product [Effrenium voratum]